MFVYSTRYCSHDTCPWTRSFIPISIPQLPMTDNTLLILHTNQPAINTFLSSQPVTFIHCVKHSAPTGYATILYLLRRPICLITSILDGGQMSTFIDSLESVSGRPTMAVGQLYCSLVFYPTRQPTLLRGNQCVVGFLSHLAYV